MGERFPDLEPREIKIADTTYVGIRLARLIYALCTIGALGLGALTYNLWEIQDMVHDHIDDDRGHLTADGQRRVLDVVRDNADAIEDLTRLVKQAHDHD